MDSKTVLFTFCGALHWESHEGGEARGEGRLGSRQGPVLALLVDMPGSVRGPTAQRQHPRDVASTWDYTSQHCVEFNAFIIFLEGNAEKIKLLNVCGTYNVLSSFWVEGFILHYNPLEAVL